jgi:hypothetical protein
MTARAVEFLWPTGVSDICKHALREFADIADLSQAAGGLIIEHSGNAQTIILSSETERLFLGRIDRCIFATEGLISGAVEAAVAAKATFGFLGILMKRDLRVVSADSAVRRLADAIVASPKVQQEIAPLDLKRLELELCADRWRLRTMLVGAAFVDMRLPPTRRYIPLGETQARALPRAITAVAAVLQDYLER